MSDIEQAWREAIQNNAGVVAARNDELATKLGEQAAQGARAFLERHADLVAPGLLEVLVAAERHQTVTTFLGERAIGLRNDSQSIQRGISVLIDTKGMDEVRRYKLYEDMCKEHHPELLPSFSLVGKVSGRNYHAMRLEKGVLAGRIGSWSSQLRLSFNGETQGGTTLPSPIMPVDIDMAHIVRIEGDAGELWQNPDPRLVRLLRPTSDLATAS